MTKKTYNRFKVEAWDILQYMFKTKKINDHVLHFVATCSTPVNFERLRKSVQVTTEVFPLLLCGYKENGNKRPCWETTGCGIDNIVTLVESEMEGLTDQILGEGLDTFKGPQMKLSVIRSSKADTLVILMNHMLCDAAGFKHYLYLLCDVYNQLGKNPDYIPPTLGSRKLNQIFKKFSFFEKIKIFKSKDEMFRYDEAEFSFEGDLTNPFIERRTISSEVFGHLKAYAKNHGATINDMVLTVYIRTLFQKFGHVIALPSTVDLRKYLKNHKAEGICNLCTNLTCDIGSELGETFEKTLEKVTKVMSLEKSRISCMKNITLLEKVFDFLPYRWAESMVDKTFTNAPIAFTNIGIIDKKQFVLDGVTIADAFMSGSIKYAPYFQLAISTFDNKPTLSVNLYGSDKDQQIISEFLDAVTQELCIVGDSMAI